MSFSDKIYEAGSVHTNKYHAPYLLLLHFPSSFARYANSSVNFAFFIQGQNDQRFRQLWPSSLLAKSIHNKPRKFRQREGLGESKHVGLGEIGERDATEDAMRHDFLVFDNVCTLAHDSFL